MLCNVLFLNKYVYSTIIMGVSVVLLQLLNRHCTNEVLWNNVKYV